MAGRSEFGRRPVGRAQDAREGPRLRVTGEVYADWKSVYRDNVAWVYALMFGKVGNRPDAEHNTLNLTQLGHLGRDQAGFRPRRRRRTLRGHPGHRVQSHPAVRDVPQWGWGTDDVGADEIQLVSSEVPELGQVQRVVRSSTVGKVADLAEHQRVHPRDIVHSSRRTPHRSRAATAGPRGRPAHAQPVGARTRIVQPSTVAFRVCRRRLATSTSR